MHFFGEVLGYLFVLVWLPYAGWSVGRAFVWAIFPTGEPENREAKEVLPPRKPSKRSYPVETSY